MRALRVVGELLLTAGVLIVLFLVYQLWWTDVIALRATDQARQELLTEFGMTGDSP